MKKKGSQYSLLLLFGGLVCITGLKAASVNLSFYGAAVSLHYDPALILRETIKTDAASLTSAWRSLEQKPVQSLLDDLLRYKNQLRLNDWLYYKLMHQGVEQILTGRTAVAKELLTAFLLSKTGIDVRVTFANNNLYTNAYVAEELFEVPIIEDRGRQFANLTAARLHTGPLQAMYMLDIPNQRPGRVFSFSLAQRPMLEEQPVNKVFSFTYSHTVYEVPLSYDARMVELLKDYPLTGEMNYIGAQPSMALLGSLPAALSNLIEGKSTHEALEILVSVTRSGFRYKEDNTQFGRSKPMVADELFFYPQSDCEDRTALFYMLVKELLALPMVVIAYDDHISLAVAAPDMDGDAVKYNGLRYIFCDPTGPSNSSFIGRIPEGYEHKPFEIIGHYPE